MNKKYYYDVLVTAWQFIKAYIDGSGEQWEKDKDNAFLKCFDDLHCGNDPFANAVLSAAFLAVVRNKSAE